ncbi:MAG: EAL domain-containing protein [Halofilum sp. (in: g-proteobacteria)]
MARAWTAFLAICFFLPAAFAAPARNEVPTTLVFGSDVHYPPFEWRANGGMQGFNIDLARALAEAGNREFGHESGPWPDIVEALARGQVDVVPMLRTAERERRFDFSEPFYFVQTGVFAKTDAPNITRVSDLSGRTVAVEAHSHSEAKFSNAPGITPGLHRTDNSLEALRAVEQNRIEYAVVNTVVARRLIRLHEFDLEQKGPPIWSHAYAFAVADGRPALSAWLDRALNSVIASGEFERIHAQWADDLEVSTDEWRDLAWPGAAIALPALALIVGALAWNRILRRRVAAHTVALTEELERRRQAEASVSHHARHEPVSGLPRRVYFVELAQAALGRTRDGARIEAMVLHVRNIAGLTRAFGYASGEEALCGFAQRLRSLGVDATADFGGHTFAALVINRDASALVSELSRPLAVGSVDFDPVIAAGIARARDPDISASELVRRAETALSRAGGVRSTCVLYDHSMEPDPDDLELVSDFRRTGGEQIYAVFQPQVRLSDGACAGCEALARWDHPRLGAIPPSRFVPLLENAGLSETLTARMVERALAQAKQLRAAKFACPVAINVSMYDLLESTAIQAFESTLARHGCLPDELKVELTETTFAENFEVLRRGLEQLHSLGIRSAIDDFGTGYASLAYVSRFAVDEVKIDRMFVTDMLRNTRHRAIVRATIGLGKDLNLAVVAEGAEDDATLDALREDGCDRVQGFAVAKPMHSADLMAFIEAHAPARKSIMGRE